MGCLNLVKNLKDSSELKYITQLLIHNKTLKRICVAMIYQTFSIDEVVVPYFENACFKKTFYVKKGENDG